MLAEKRLENRILRISVSDPFFFSFLLPEVSLFYSSLGLSPKNNTQRSKWKLRGSGGGEQRITALNTR